MSCTDGLVLEPVPEFSETQLILPRQSPSPLPAPKTPLEKAGRKINTAREQLAPYLGTALGLLLISALFFRFLRLIYELSTTSPE